jgi:hypothetical protein
MTTVATLAIVVRGRDCFLNLFSPIFILGDSTMKLKFKALALVAMMTAAPAFAAQWDLGTNPLDATIDTTSTAAVSGYVTAAGADYLAAAGAAIYDGSVALMAQVGDANYGFIDQSAGVGNFSAIMQDSSTNAMNVGYVSQSGNGNFGVINQH